MKILMVSANYPPKIGGPASSVPELSKKLSEKGHQVQIVTVKFPGFKKKTKEQGFAVFRAWQPSQNAEKSSTFSNILSALSMSLLVAQRIKKFKPDLIHAHDLNLSALASILGKKIAFSNIPILSKYTGDLSLEYLMNYGKMPYEKIKNKYSANKKMPLKIKFFDKIQNWLEKHSTKIACPSEFQQNQLLKKRIKKIKTIVLRNAVDLQLFNYKKFSQTKKYILFSGRLVKWKGISHLIKAMKELVKENPELRLKIIGTGPEKEKIVKQIAVFGLEKNVELLGKVKRSKMPEIISKSSMVIMPSLYDPFPHLMLETLAMKKPLLASKTGGIPEVVKHKKTGLLFEPNSDESIVKSIKMLKNQKLEQKIVKQGLKHVQQNYSWNFLTQKFEQAYKETLNA